MSLLRKGDKLALVGDSITEQLRYSRLVEAYIHACAWDLGVEVRQSGWSGETTGACLARVDEDVLAYRPDVVVTHYGMNDFSYDHFSEAKAEAYRLDNLELARRIKALGARQLLASPTNISLTPAWCETPVPVETLNASLARIRDIGRALAQAEGLPFCDMLAPMLAADARARALHGAGFNIAGDDGVHPDWAGHLVMATTELCALGFDGDLGTLVLDAGAGEGRVEGRGHELLAAGPGRLRIRSERFPLSLGAGSPGLTSTLAAGAALCPFFERLNRLRFRLDGAAPASRWRLSWGAQEGVFDGAELAQGINLAERFASENPLSAAFNEVYEAVGRKQEFENHQLHEVFHGTAGEGASAAERRSNSEAQRRGLVQAVTAARKAVEHEIHLVKI